MDITTSNILKSLTVEVSRDKQGSGVIYRLGDNRQYAYIFTAKHNLIPKGSQELITPEEIEVHYKFNNSDEFKKIDVAECILGAEPDDFAVLLVSQDSIEGVVNAPTNISIAADFPLTGQDDLFHFRGYPNTPPRSEASLPITDCQFLDADNTTFTLKAPEVTRSTSGLCAINYFAGFSGSGVFIEEQGFLHLIGIVTDLWTPEGVFATVECFQVASILNSLLESRQIPRINFLYFNPDFNRVAEDFDIGKFQSLDTGIPDVKEEIERAQNLVNECQHREAALIFSHLAEYFEGRSEYFQANSFSHDSAKEFERAGDELAAVNQYIHTAELILYNAFTPNRRLSEIEEADNLIQRLEEPNLFAQLLLIKSFEAFASLRFKDAGELLEQSQAFIEQIKNNEQRASILQRISFQMAIVGVLQGDKLIAYHVLERTLEMLPDSAKCERCEVLYNLICVSTEYGDWEKADFAYNQACHLIDRDHDKRLHGLLQMHYGASLAKRTELEEAFKVFCDALETLDGYVDAYTMSLVYQNMQYMLRHNGALFFTGLEEHERRRIDLFRTTQLQNKGYFYELRAIEKLNKKNLFEAQQYIVLALYHYWKEGAWLGIRDAHEIIALLSESDKNFSEALFAAIRASDNKIVVQYSQKLRDSANEDTLSQVIKRLLIKMSSVREQQLAVEALEHLADVTPPALLHSVVDFLIELIFLENNETPLDSQTQRHAIKTLKNLVPQLRQEQTDRILKITFENIKSPDFRSIQEELLHLIGELFAQIKCKVDLTLYQPIVDYVLTLIPEDPLYRQGMRVAAYLARTANIEIRNKVLNYLKNTPIQPEGLRLVGFLNESLPEKRLAEAINQILKVDRGAEESGMFHFGTIVPQQINNFNEILPEALYDTVIDGLLKIILNANNLLYIRGDAIVTLSNLPRVVTEKRANELVDYLLLSSEGSISISPTIQSTIDPHSPIRMNAGSIEQIRYSSLKALGHVYPLVNSERQKRLSSVFITYSRDFSPLIRQGVAIALNNVQGEFVMATRVLLSLIVLTNDTDTSVRIAACAAVGNLFGNNSAQFLGKLHAKQIKFLGTFLNLIEKWKVKQAFYQTPYDTLLEDIIERLLFLSETEKIVNVRAAIAHSLHKLLENKQFNKMTRGRIEKALEALSHDISFKVRSQTY